MKNRLPQFLVWFAIFFVLHLSIYTILSRIVSRLVAENGSHLTPMVMLLSLPLNLLAMPMRVIWFGIRTVHFSIGAVRAMQIFNSVIWGTVLSLVVLFRKRAG